MNSVTLDDFQQEVLDSETPVLVDFWAEWCGPCRAMTPVLEKIDSEEQRLKIVKVNIDEEQELANKYRIRSIPAMFLFKDGEVVEQIIGALPEQKLKTLLDLLLTEK